MEIEIRRAVVADAEAAAWCHLICWQEGYAELLEPAKLAERTADVELRIQRWTERLEGGVLRWVAVNPDPAAAVRDRVIGFASPGPTRDEDAPAALELYAIYVREKWWGSGLGGRLMDVAIGKEAASLWVLAGNERAKAFYRKQGFAEDGTQVDEPFFGVPEIRMVRPSQ
jgi:GNAT superfamily N-acetyltransferase